MIPSLHGGHADLEGARVVRVDGVDPDLEGVAAGALLQRVAAEDQAAGADVVQHTALQGGNSIELKKINPKNAEESNGRHSNSRNKSSLVSPSGALQRGKVWALDGSNSNSQSRHVSNSTTNS